jgi:hypothetical protein
MAMATPRTTARFLITGTLAKDAPSFEDNSQSRRRNVSTGDVSSWLSQPILYRMCMDSLGVSPDNIPAACTRRGMSPWMRGYAGTGMCPASQACSRRNSLAKRLSLCYRVIRV